MTAPAVRPLVGRQAELGALRDALDSARSGRGGLVLVAGEAGVGKTRLVEALAEEAGAVGVALRWGRAWEGGGVAAYWPWAQVVSAIAADAPPDALARRLGPGATEVALVAPELCARLPGLAPAPPSTAPDAIVRLYDAVGALLVASAAEEGSLVVALDDLHFADEASLRLLAHLAPTLAASTLVVVGTHRPLEAGAPPRVRRWLAAAGRHGTTVAVAGLDEAGVARLLTGVAGPALGPGMARRIHALTDGNPFLALEAGRLVEATGGVGAGAVLPTEAGALVRRRLGALDEPARSVLGRGAVLGREADLATLVAVAEQEAMAVLDALGEAQRLGLVVEAGMGRWAFSHALVREALLEDLSGDEQAEVHRRALLALEAGAGSSGADPARLAHHAAAGADAATAAYHCERAGRAALDALAFDDAAQWFQRALDRLGEHGGGDAVGRVELLLALGEARARAGEFPEGRRACRRALALARRARAPELVARAALGLAPLPEWAAYDKARVAALEEALAVLPEEDSALRARVLAALAAARLEGGLERYRERVLDPADEAVAMARRLADPATLRAVLTNWHFVASPTPHARGQASLAVAEELVELCASAGDRERLVVARHWLATDRFALGDIEGMRAELERSVEEAAELRLPFLVWGGTFPQAALALLAGRLEEAERLADQALATGQRSGFSDVDTVWEGQMLQIRYHQGRFAELVELLGRSIGRGHLPDETAALLAVALAELGRLDEARPELARAWAELVAAVPVFGGLALAPLADACLLVADAARAAELYEKLLPFSGQHLDVPVMVYSLGSCDLYLGRLATLLGRFDEAEAHFGAARAMHDRLGARIWAAHTDADQARMLVARGHPGDAERAAGLLARARDEFAAMGMGVFAGRAAGALAEVGAGRPGERAGLRRDGQVWSLAYAGTAVHLQDTKGIAYLAHLLSRPNQEVHALELAGHAADAGDPQEAERARLAVRRSLQATLARIAEVHPELGRHLASTVRVGLRSSYVPDPLAPLRWDVDVGPFPASAP